MLDIMLYEVAQRKKGCDMCHSMDCQCGSFSQYKNQFRVLGLLVGMLAAYLSWTLECNQSLPMETRVAYAATAFFFGGFYIAYYLLVSKPMCK